IEAQARKFLSFDGANAAVVERNDVWLRALSLIDFLRDVGKYFTVNHMMAKDSVRSRLEDRAQGISYTEFSYMLLQAYDFYWLYQHHNCRLQLGGSDQWGNITAGTEYIRRRTDLSGGAAFGLTFPLITTTSGTKFGKTEEGNVWLDPKRTSPYRFYQFWVNAADADVMQYIRFFTDIDGAELAELNRVTNEQPEKRQAQRQLAEYMTTLVHGPTECIRAIEATRVLFGEPLDGIDEQTLREIFAEVPSGSISGDELSGGLTIVELLVRTGAVKSKGEARRLVEGGGAYVNNVRIDGPTAVISDDHRAAGSMLVLRLGKKRYHVVNVSGDTAPH
ncbi:MAG: tyrosine--tRNA ligase, partial [Bdellovibrionales bacterium]|nr:tyrosine--tRNA ligase [Bdellovibrionales bacterium]